MFVRKILCTRNLNLIRTYCDNSGSLKPEAFSTKGDEGRTKLLSGKLVCKDAKIFEAIGAAEELSSYIGLAREFGLEAQHDYCDKLKRIQTVLIDITTVISSTDSNTNQLISHGHTKELEEWIQDYCQKLPPVEQFIIPGGGMASASLHVARSICRRAERVIVSLVNTGEVNKETQIYLNRLSDFLFTVSRIAAKLDKRTESIYLPQLAKSSKLE